MRWACWTLAGLFLCTIASASETVRVLVPGRPEELSFCKGTVTLELKTQTLVFAGIHECPRLRVEGRSVTGQDVTEKKLDFDFSASAYQGRFQIEPKHRFPRGNKGYVYVYAKLSPSDLHRGEVQLIVRFKDPSRAASKR